MNLYSRTKKSINLTKSKLRIVLMCLVLSLNSCNENENKVAEEKAAVESDTLSSNEKYFTNCKTLAANAAKMDSLLLKQTEIDTLSANKAMKAFTDFAYYCQSDTMSPIYLIKTAQVARAVNNIPQAKLVLDHCVNTYTSFKDRPAAIFLLAQLFDEPTYLNNEYEAGKLYQKIIDEYPKSDWAASAKGALGFMGKSDAEILKELKRKNK
jgi:hypothetical protein